MKIILLKDIPKVGKKYEVKDVAEGFASNMLLPRGLAQVATKQALEKLEILKSQTDAEKKIQGELLVKSFETIKNLNLNISGKANDKGHLFAGITKEMIAQEIQKVARLNIDPESISLSKPIKEVGEHKISIHVGDKKTEFVVNVVGE